MLAVLSAPLTWQLHATLSQVTLLQGAAAWVTLSQARFGAQIASIREQTRGNFSRPAPPLQQLGYIWSLPQDASSSAGLGGGITWAVDGKLCDALLPLFKEDIIGIELVSCAVLKAVLHRAFSSWSDNHPLLSFVDVTAECEAMGQLTPDCPLAEVWITALGPSTRRPSARSLDASQPSPASASANVDDVDLTPVYDAISSLGTVMEQADGQRTAATASPRARCEPRRHDASLSIAHVQPHYTRTRTHSCDT
jgi:hypothetical protein